METGNDEVEIQALPINLDDQLNPEWEPPDDFSVELLLSFAQHQGLYFPGRSNPSLDLEVSAPIMAPFDHARFHDDPGTSISQSSGRNCRCGQIIIT